jgi:hypothetical protein
MAGVPAIVHGGDLPRTGDVEGDEVFRAGNPHAFFIHEGGSDTGAGVPIRPEFFLG